MEISDTWKSCTAQHLPVFLSVSLSCRHTWCDHTKMIIQCHYGSQATHAFLGMLPLYFMLCFTFYHLQFNICHLGFTIYHFQSSFTFTFYHLRFHITIYRLGFTIYYFQTSFVFCLLFTASILIYNLPSQFTIYHFHSIFYCYYILFTTEIIYINNYFNPYENYKLQLNNQIWP